MPAKKFAKKSFPKVEKKKQIPKKNVSPKKEIKKELEFNYCMFQINHFKEDTYLDLKEVISSMEENDKFKYCYNITNNGERLCREHLGKELKVKEKPKNYTIIMVTDKKKIVNTWKMELIMKEDIINAAITGFEDMEDDGKVFTGNYQIVFKLLSSYASSFSLKKKFISMLEFIKSNKFLFDSKEQWAQNLIKLMKEKLLAIVTIWEDAKKYLDELYPEWMPEYAKENPDNVEVD